MKWSVVSLLAFCLLVDGSLVVQKNDLKASLGPLLKQELKAYHYSKQKSPLFQELIDIFRYESKSRMDKDDDTIAPRADACVVCESFHGAFIDLIREGQTPEQVILTAVETCFELNMQTQRVCQGMVELNVRELAYIFLNRPELTVHQFCGVKQQSACPDYNVDMFEWSVDVDPNIPPLDGSKDTSIPPSDSDLTIVQITDPHYDPNYAIGAWAACDEPVCCRWDQVAPEGSATSDKAGRWGDYRSCDAPLEALIDAFTQVKRNHQKIDYVYFTGDIVDHGVWDTSIQRNKQEISLINKLVDETFKDIPIFPVLGNHEAHPVNLFAPHSVPESLNSKWLYDFVAEEWSKWLPEEALETVRQGGYYTVLVRPGFRVITINNNECYVDNWWIAYNTPEESKKQLQWLHDTLLEAEKNGEMVHIVGHVPPGSPGCFRIFGREYRRIVDRFWNTISAQFGGHTHRDEFNIFYSREDPTKAVNVFWNGGSIVAFTNVNPNYRVYTMDTTTYQINSHQTWIYELNEANEKPNETPRWYKEYDFQKEYGIDNLSPRALDGLVESFATSPSKLQRYFELKYKQGAPTLAKGCSNSCLANHMCLIVTTEFGNSPKCDRLMGIWNAQK